MLEGKPLPTIWDVPDDLRERIEPVILDFVNANLILTLFANLDLTHSLLMVVSPSWN